MKIGLATTRTFTRPSPLSAVVQEARQAEQSGFSSFWLPNVFALDAMTTIAVCAQETTQLTLGTAVVPTYSRHPFAMAQQALSLQAATQGRFVLGIGPSHQMVIEAMWGLSYDKPFTHTKEYLTVLKALLEQGVVSYQGTQFRVMANLTVPGAKPCPVLLAALGPKMLGLAGSLCDGTVTAETGPKTLRNHIIPRLLEAATEAGRPSPRVVAILPVSVTTDISGTRAALTRELQGHTQLPSYQAMFAREGVEGPGDVSILGDEAAVGEQVQQLAEMGVTDLAAIPAASIPNRAATLERTYAFLADLARRNNG